MPRGPRQVSPTGYYHVVMRGNDRKIIFESDSDRYKFLDSVDRLRDKDNVKLFAYCLMNNHVHMLICAEMDALSLFNQKIKDSYCYYYNHKYSRTGTLFEGRFWSRAITCDNDLIHVIRYIHKNPVAAGLSAMDTYRWSSYNEFVQGNIYCDVDDISFLWRSVEEFTDVMKVVDNDDSEIAIYDYLRLSDDEAYAIAVDILQGNLPNEVSDYSAARRNAIVREMKTKGMSIVQISRLTGVNRGVIARTCKGIQTERRYI